MMKTSNEEENSDKVKILTVAVLGCLFLIVALDYIQSQKIHDLEKDIDMLSEIVDELCIKGNLEECGEIIESYGDLDD